jgi:transposase
LLRTNGRAFLARLELPDAAGQRVEIALAIIDELERQLAPLERQLGVLARRQAGCQALMRFYGIGAITATTIVSELGDVARCRPRARRSAAPGWTSACIAPIAARAPASSPARAPPAALDAR